MINAYVLTSIRTNPCITNKELANLLGLTEYGICWNIKMLKSKGLLRRVWPDNIFERINEQSYIHMGGRSELWRTEI